MPTSRSRCPTIGPLHFRVNDLGDLEMAVSLASSHFQHVGWKLLSASPVKIKEPAIFKCSLFHRCGGTACVEHRLPAQAVGAIRPVAARPTQSLTRMPSHPAATLYRPRAFGVRSLDVRTGRDQPLLDWPTFRLATREHRRRYVGSAVQAGIGRCVRRGDRRR
jgi:hypothetical protein